MKDKETLQKILDKKIESLEGMCDILDGAYDWFKVFTIPGACEKTKEEFFKTILAFAKAYEDYITTKNSITVLKYVLDFSNK